jgi:hypothetical protein
VTVVGELVEEEHTAPQPHPRTRTCEAVEAAGGFVQEQHARVGDQRDADVGALGLPAADALLKRVADLDVPAGSNARSGRQVCFGVRSDIG